MSRGTGSKFVGNDALTSTAILLKTGPCSLCGYHIFNTTTAEAYVQFYNAAAAADVTVGTTVHDFVLGIPAETAAGLGSGACRSLFRPLQFTKGIVVASTTAAAGATGAITVVEFDVGD